MGQRQRYFGSFYNIIFGFVIPEFNPTRNFIGDKLVSERKEIESKSGVHFWGRVWA
jgi:hypothetical protein